MNRIRKVTSNELCAKLGVPQGCTLGPIYILVPVNNFQYCTSTAYISLFADDT